MAVLAINAGSSSLKFALYPVQEEHIFPALLIGVIEGLQPGGQMKLTWQHGGQCHEQGLLTDHKDPFDRALQSLQALLDDVMHIELKKQGKDMQLLAIAHRVVHGGEKYREAVLVDQNVLKDLSILSPLAPLHQPHNLAGITAFMRAFPMVPQIACFDTAFHSTMPEEEYLFAIPLKFNAQGIRRYGFHGLSYQFVANTLMSLSDRAHGRVVMAHLGNGASLCGMLQGKSHATTMGFSALDGLMMGTRCGSIDAGVVLHLLASGWTDSQVQDLLYKQSGLLGVSGISADMRQLCASEEPHAKLAVRMFNHRVVREIGALTASLGGLDLIAFTGGIGEHNHVLRENVCQQLGYLGIVLDKEKNTLANGTTVACLSTPESTIEVWMIPTDEGFVAAQAALKWIPQTERKSAIS
ncbi:MAG: acetate/propionate family kinase [Undibacterium sp.]|nr:acetate/propionate family kinase [Undibacterium sp.]